MATNIFLSHDWGSDGKTNHARVIKINDALQALGFVTWFDQERMSGHIHEKMASGIETTQCVIAFITERYHNKVTGKNEKDNCKLEFDYAKCKTQLMAVVLDETMKNPSKWNGSIGMFLGGKIYVDMTGNLNDQEYLFTQLAVLQKELKAIGVEPSNSPKKEPRVAINAFDGEGKEILRDNDQKLPTIHQKDSTYRLSNEDLTRDWGYKDLKGLIEREHITKLKALFDNKPYLMDIVSKTGDTLQLLAARKNLKSVMKMFIDKEGFDCLQERNSNTVYHSAVRAGNLDVLKMLLKYKPEGMNVQVGEYSSTPLHSACSNQRYEVIEMLLQENEVGINLPNKYGNTPLHLACMKNDIKLVSLLLKQNGIDVHAKNNKNTTAVQRTTDSTIKKMISKFNGGDENDV